MRLEPFFDVLAQRLSLNLDAVRYFAASPNFKGGWETWLQCCIGFAFSGYQASTMTREAPYPNSSARADFLIVRADKDATYLELKCHSSQETVEATWRRFAQDRAKIAELQARDSNLNCIALLGTWGIFSSEDIAGFRGSLPSARVLDFAANPPKHTLLVDVAVDGAARLFLLGSAGR